MHADSNAQQLGNYSQRDWTNSKDKMKFNQLLDDATEKLEVEQVVKFSDLAKQAEFHANFSYYKANTQIIYTSMFLFA